MSETKASGDVEVTLSQAIDLAVQSLRDKEFSTADRVASSILAAAPKSPEGYYLRYLARRQIDDLEAKESDLLKALLLRPNGVDLWRDLFRHNYTSIRNPRLKTVISVYRVLAWNDESSLQALCIFARHLGDYDLFLESRDRLSDLKGYPKQEDSLRPQFLSLFSNMNIPSVEDWLGHAQPFNETAFVHASIPRGGRVCLIGEEAECRQALEFLEPLYPDTVFSTASGSDELQDGDLRLSLRPEDALHGFDGFLFPPMIGHSANFWNSLPGVVEDGGLNPKALFNRHFQSRYLPGFDYLPMAEIESLRSRSEVAEVAARFDDEPSRQSYLATARADWAVFLQTYYENVLRRTQYFDYVQLKRGDVILNIGVAEGHEIPALLAIIGKEGKMYDIDPDGHLTLHPVTARWCDVFREQIVVSRLALADTNDGILMDVGAMPEDSRLKRRNTKVQHRIDSRTLETYIAENQIEKISLIKIDIEGGEGFIADDLVRVLNKHRCQLALSIYHTVDQFIDLPTKMMNGLENYRFYFYRYSPSFNEGTLYCIPKEIEPRPLG